MQNRRKSPLPALFAIAFLGVAALVWWGSGQLRPSQGKFDGQRAFQDVQSQMSLGPRTMGSKAHNQVVSYITSELKKAGWEIGIQDSVMLEHPIQNLVATRGKGPPWIVVGAHYDSRSIADHDPDPAKQDLPVPGANDGASGVAVLLELARSLPREIDQKVTLVFFDAEDNGNIPGWDWILGSQAYVQQLQSKPDAAVIVDMIGDADLNIFLERNSDTKLSGEIWAQAAKLGYSNHFIPIPKHSMIDDHSPFLAAGIPAVDIIDFDYPYYHTTLDTVDKVSAQSLQIVGDTLLEWIVGKR